jgi:hypothetical protein
MSIFTDRELEFLASLRTDWRRRYWSELALLLKETPDTRSAPSRGHALRLMWTATVPDGDVSFQDNDPGALVANGPKPSFNVGEAASAG